MDLRLGMTSDEIFDGLGIDDREIIITKKEFMRMACEANKETCDEWSEGDAKLGFMLGMYSAELLGRLTNKVFE